MCIAIGKPIGQKIPSDEILTNCFINNPDGAGFAFNLNGEVIIRKGYMKLDSFLKAIHDCDKKYNLKDKGVLIHTRITTHGGTNPSMTHPFPICSDEGALKKIEYRSPYAVVHNGIIPLTSYEASRKTGMSDTAIFVSKYLTKIAANKNWFNVKENIELIADLIESKMAILNGSGKIIMTAGFIEDNGIFYSNTSYSDNYYSHKIKTYPFEDNFDDFPKDKKTKKDKSKGKNVKKVLDPYVIPLMRLKMGETVVFDDGTTEYFYDGLSYFISEEDEIYMGFDEETMYDKIIDAPLEYVGQGKFYNGNLNIIDFEPDCYTSEENLYGYEFCY